MTEREKKLKAAITAVIYYIQEEEANAAKPQNRWSRFARETTMNNRMIVQRRGRVMQAKRV
jgi:hypothetical protein